MKVKFSWFAALTICLLFLTSAAFAGNINVTIPDPAPLPYIEFDNGSGDGSVTYSGVVFSESSLYSPDAQFYNVGVLWSGQPAVLSSNQATSGLENILVTLPGFATAFSVNFGTFDGSPVTFLLSNGDHFVLQPAGSGYAVPTVFSDTNVAHPFDWVLITSPDYVLNINNVNYTPVPERSNLAMLLGLGIFNLAAVFGVRRKLI